MSKIHFTDTAISKAHRYLSRRAMKNEIRDPWTVWHDTQRGSYIIRVPGERTPTKDEIDIITTEQPNGMLVVTQTECHYDWSNYTQIGSDEFTALLENDEQ